MAVPKEVMWDKDPHTDAKHRILKGYLDAYFPIVVAGWPSTGVAYIDAFAGPGEYKDGSKGSPIIALNSANRTDVLNRSTQISFVFIEDDADRFDHLSSMIESRPFPPEFSITSLRGKCEDVLLHELLRLRLFNGPMFVNFDGWGVDTPARLVRRVGSGRSPEVMITFQAQWFTRFAGLADQEAGDRVFGDRLWRAVVDLSSPAEKKRFLVEGYCNRLKEWGFPYHLLFELVDEGGHELLLVFGTANDLGIKKMKDAMWRVDPTSGSRFRDPRDPSQLSFELVESDPDLALLKRQILGKLEDGGQTLTALCQFVLLETIYKETQTRRAVDQLEAEHKVLCQHARSYSDFIVELAPPTLFD